MSGRRVAPSCAPDAPVRRRATAEWPSDESVLSAARAPPPRLTPEQRAAVATLDSSLRQFGVAPGPLSILERERRAALASQRSGAYVVWRCAAHFARTHGDCARIGPESRCLCDHDLAAHAPVTAASCGALPPACAVCTCRAFALVPSRPEEIGEWWLPRRADFDAAAWRARCRCRHSHAEHDPVRRSCRRCACACFAAAYACVVCDRSGDEHEVVIESEAERIAARLPVGDDFCPLAELPGLQAFVFSGEAARRSSGHVRAPRISSAAAPPAASALPPPPSSAGPAASRRRA